MKKKMNGILSPKGQRIYDSLMGEAEDTYRFGSLSKTQQDNIIVPKIKDLYNSQQLSQNDARIIADRFSVLINGLNAAYPKNFIGPKQPQKFSPYPDFQAASGQAKPKKAATKPITDVYKRQTIPTVSA